MDVFSIPHIRPFCWTQGSVGVGEAEPSFTGQSQGTRNRLRLRRMSGPRANSSCLSEGHPPPAFPTPGFGQEKRARSCSARGEMPSNSSSSAAPHWEEMGRGHPALPRAWALPSARRCAARSLSPQNVSVAMIRKWKNDTLSSAASFQSGQQPERRQSQGT